MGRSQMSPIFTPLPPLRHGPSLLLRPHPSEQKMTSSWPDPHALRTFSIILCISSYLYLCKP